jgi:hypothetical protein
MTEELVIGVAWFDEVQWHLLIDVVPDRNELDESFQAWERSALDAVRLREAQGRTVRRVPVEVAALCAWCRERKLPVNGAARAQYVSSLLRNTRLSGRGDR